MKPLLSIVCPARNAADTIPSLVASLGPGDARAELVLCDDASTDGTAQAALDAAKETGFRVRVLRNADRRGAGPSRNLAASAALGAWLWCVDADDLLYDGALDEVLSTIEGNPDADCVLVLTNCDKRAPEKLDGSAVANASCGPWSKAIRSELWEPFPCRPQDDLSVHLAIADKVERVAATSRQCYIYHPAVRGSYLQQGREFKKDQTLLSAFADGGATEREAEWVAGDLRLAADLIELLPRIKHEGVREVLARRLRVIALGVHTGIWNY